MEDKKNAEKVRRIEGEEEIPLLLLLASTSIPCVSLRPLLYPFPLFWFFSSPSLTLLFPFVEVRMFTGIYLNKKCYIKYKEIIYN